MKEPAFDITRSWAYSSIAEACQSTRPDIRPQESGKVKTVMTGIAVVSGLPGTAFEELIRFPHDIYGIAFNLEEEEIGVVLLGNHWNIKAGDPAERTGRVMDIPVGEELIGRVIDPLGRPLDNLGPLDTSERWPVERKAPEILERAPVSVPLQTGIKVIDALVPIGRGQRELILGDRQTGKTAIAVETILNQRDQGVICIYCAIGQRAASVAHVLSELSDAGALSYTLIILAEGNDPPGLNFIAPYAATSIGEYLMKKGRDVLIVYDDLTQHARAYREISLLLRRPPGREAFPGDIFYIHSRLLERSTRLRPESGGGSLTALPIIETEAQNIAAYIPTNLISITDGQLYLSPQLFELGILPAIDVARSVSRVGGKAQLKAYHRLTSELKLDYAQFQELETFARFGSRLDEAGRQVLQHGERIRALLNQGESDPFSVAEQLLLLTALVSNLLDQVPLEQYSQAENNLRQASESIPKDLLDKINQGQELTENETTVLQSCATDALRPFLKPGT